MSRGRKSTAKMKIRNGFRAMPGSKLLFRYWQRQSFVERRKSHVAAVSYKFYKFLRPRPEKDLIRCANRAFIHDNSSGT